jgi:short-subunit dehydrogenase
MTSSNPDRSGRPLAVITGGSSGIGAAFARRVAADHDVVLVARRPDRLASVRDELARDHPDGRFDTVTADLSTSDGTGAVVERLARGGVDLLVNNAGAGYHGRFVDEPSDRIAAEVALDCVAVALLTRAALPSMVAAGHGAVVNISSTAAFQPVATMAVYGAAKAFVLSLSEALHVETRDTGVTILAVCPGGTDTGFFDAAGAQFMTRRRSTPDQVVDATLAALRRGKAVEVPGVLNKVSSLGYRFLPRSVIARGSGWSVRAR